MTVSRMHPLIKGYLEYLADISRKAPGTVRDIKCTLLRVSRAMDQLKVKKELWHLELEDYLRWLEFERQQGSNSRCLNKYLSHLRGFLNYAWRSGRTEKNVLDGFYLRDDQCRQAPRSLSLQEAEQLLKACPKSTFTERRNRMIILLLYGCGLRTQELCSLNITDINRESGELFVSKGKGSCQRVIPIPEVVYTELLAYLLERDAKRGPLFRTEIKHKRISSKAVGEAVRVTARQAGISWKVTPKTLRHTYATHLMDSGVDIAVISSLMGHRSPSETGVYLHVLPGKAENAVHRLQTKERNGD